MPEPYRLFVHLREGQNRLDFSHFQAIRKKLYGYLGPAKTVGTVDTCINHGLKPCPARVLVCGYEFPILVQICNLKNRVPDKVSCFPYDIDYISLGNFVYDRVVVCTRPFRRFGEFLYSDLASRYRPARIFAANKTRVFRGTRIPPSRPTRFLSISTSVFVQSSLFSRCRNELQNPVSWSG